MYAGMVPHVSYVSISFYVLLPLRTDPKGYV